MAQQVAQQVPARLTDPATLITLVMIVGLLAVMTLRLGPRFVVRRLAGLVFVILALTFVTFIMGSFAPGDAVIDQLGNHATQASLARLRHFYGLDLPWYQQYGNFLSRLVHLDLGYSYSNDSQTVWSTIQLYLPASITLGVSGTLASLVLGVPLGLLAAVRANTRMDTAVQGVALVLYALPAFVFIPLLIPLLGLGVQPPSSSLGRMMYDGSRRIYIQPTEVLWPVIVLTALVLYLSFVGNGIADAFNPRSQD